jgi:CRISPR-associated protein Csd1
MLVQALAEYADTRLAGPLADPAFENKPVPFLIEVGRDGAFLGVTERTETIQRGKKTITQAQALLVPKSPVNRNTGLHPLIGCDDIKYVLGAGAWTKPKERNNHQERHEAFVARVSKAADETRDEALLRCAAFYARPDQVQRARAELEQRNAKSGLLVALSADGPVVCRQAVREWWRRHYERAFAQRTEKGGQGMCLISGRVGPIAPTHDKIKGVANLGGQAAGVSLMSFDKEAFRSYGWEQNANSPVSPGRAQAYVLALNDLLKYERGTRVDHSGTAFLFWTRRPVEWDPIAILETADPVQVKRLLLLDEGSLGLEPNEFYLLGVAGNGGRLLVRHWLHESLADVLKNVKGWFEGLRIASPSSGTTADSPKLWQLLRAIARDDPPPDRVVQLIRRAIQGQRLGLTILGAALARLRAAQGDDKFSTERAGLIRLCVNDWIKGDKMGERLDDSLDHPAYLCGRLLAIYDHLQSTAHRAQYAAHKADDAPHKAKEEVNMTVSDRYYALASTLPQLAFPKLVVLSRKHLHKLRRDHPGAAHNIEREIQELHERLAKKDARYPPPLNLEDQGRFAIGFHHQRAEAMARAMARKQEKQQKGDQ